MLIYSHKFSVGWEDSDGELNEVENFSFANLFKGKVLGGLVSTKNTFVLFSFNTFWVNMHFTWGWMSVRLKLKTLVIFFTQIILMPGVTWIMGFYKFLYQT